MRTATTKRTRPHRASAVTSQRMRPTRQIPRKRCAKPRSASANRQSKSTDAVGLLVVHRGPRMTERDANPCTHDGSLLWNRVLPVVLAATAHDDEVATPWVDLVRDLRRTATTQQEPSARAERHRRHERFVHRQPVAVAMPGDTVRA